MFVLAQGAAKSVFAIVEKESKIDATKNDGLTLKRLDGDVEFENVHFSYPERQDATVLNGFSLKVPAGKTVALCGGSGCGKSTSIQLLQRFYEPLTGCIKIDGHNIKDLNLAWMRGQMALVSQEPILFATTIRENIRQGRLDATDGEVEDAAKQANAHDFIMSLKDQYDTLVGERGSQMSGGYIKAFLLALQKIEKKWIFRTLLLTISCFFWVHMKKMLIFYFSVLDMFGLVFVANSFQPIQLRD
jgi:ATP-binding cassette subfamily B (MDR/TAP) protein 1